MIAFSQSNENTNIYLLKDPNYDYSRMGADSGSRLSADVKCVAHTFMEKLLISRQQYGIITNLCKGFGSLEVLEQYGNYMRLRVSSFENTIGQMFGMIEDLKVNYDIDQYAISQTTLEQIFQSFANLNFDNMVKTFSLASDGKTLQMRALAEA